MVVVPFSIVGRVQSSWSSSTVQVSTGSTVFENNLDFESMMVVPFSMVGRVESSSTVQLSTGSTVFECNLGFESGSSLDQYVHSCGWPHGLVLYIYRFIYIYFVGYLDRLRGGGSIPAYPP